MLTRRLTVVQLRRTALDDSHTPGAKINFPDKSWSHREGCNKWHCSCL